MRVGWRVLLLAFAVIGAGCGSSAPPATGLAGSVSRGSVSLRLDAAADSNVAPSHIPANEVTVTFRDAPMSITVLYVAGFEDRGGGSYFKHWDLTFALNGDPTAGAVYQVLVPPQQSAPALGTATSNYQDEVGSWIASGGTITVASVVGAKITFLVDAVTEDARAGGAPANAPALGVFSLNGVLTINNVNAVCDCIN